MTILSNSKCEGYTFLTLFAFMPLFLQINITLQNGGPIRCSLADLLLLVLVVYFFFKYIGRSHLRQEYFKFIKSLRFVFISLALLSVWFIFASVNSFFYIGYISKWGLFNKCIGWFILLGYFAIGSLFVLTPSNPLTSFSSLKSLKPLMFTTSVDNNNLSCFQKFVKHFLFYSFMISVLNIIFYLIWSKNPEQSFVGIMGGRFVGLSDNANAFGLLLTFALLLQIPYMTKLTGMTSTDRTNAVVLFSPRLHYLIFGFNFIALFFSGSRGALLALFAGLWYYVSAKIILFSRKNWFFVFSLLMVLLLFYACELMIAKKQRYFFNYLGHFTLFDHGIAERLSTLSNAIKLWLEHPWIGIGLGSFIEKSILSHAQPVLALHTTPIWFLTELGLIGLSLLSFFGFAIYKTLIHIKQRIGLENHWVIQTAFAIMIAFGVASLTNEITYQRYLWFYLGSLLAYLSQVVQPLPPRMEETILHPVFITSNLLLSQTGPK